MISKIEKVSENIVAFKASGIIDANDLTNTLIPGIRDFMKEHETLNYMLVLDNNLSNFSIAWWVKSLWLAIKEKAKWNRSAIISNIDKLKNFTSESCTEVPGELRIYPHEQMDEAIRWLDNANS